MKPRIAVIGASFRLPGCDSNSFWQALLDGRDLITEVDESRWSKAAYLHPERKHPGSSYTFAAGSVGDVFGFDPAFFGISPREAAVMDPQQRLLLELAWETIESAGRAPSTLRGSDCGVFVGISSTDHAYRAADDLASVGSTSGTGNTLSIAANRISYQFDLHGPSMAVDTACSSSLVAFHQACRSILSGESSCALAGGVSLHLHPYGFVSFSKATMLSPKGRCQVFDAAGDGYVRSEGGGLFLLKDYDQAVADGDPILALVAASAVNTDGSKAGLTVPNPAAQSQLLQRVYQQAGISVDAISYIEAHGTGTAVGDPIETRAIGEALGSQRSAPLPIGSVKSNLGHLEAASGVAGLAKALLSLQHRCVPATISMKTPNPKIDFDGWNIAVVQEPLTLPAAGTLTIGVNSFGFGGANAHVILQSAPEATDGQSQAVEHAEAGLIPLVISAADEGALRAMAADLAAQLQEAPAPALYDLAYSCRFRREQHVQGALLLTNSVVDAITQLQAFANPATAEQSRLRPGRRLEAAQGPAFIYSGNGCQWETMGRQLLASSAVFAQAVAEVDALFQPLAGFSLAAEMRGDNGSGRFVQTEIAQPALFALQVGITALLREQGVEPQAVCGHSVGEVAAAWAAGALSLEQAVQVIYHRSRHQGLTRGQGQMTAVGLGAAELQPLLEEFPAVALAGVNSSRGTTVAGDPEALTALETELAQRKLFFKRLDLDYAFHSPAMDPIAAGVRADLAALAPSTTTIPFISTVTGAALAGTALHAEYWWDNIRQPVQFQGAVEQLLGQGINVLIEIGAHPVLRSYLQDALRDAELDGVVILTLSRQQDTPEQLEAALAQTLLSGCPLDLARWFPVAGQRVELPAYPWQRQTLTHPVTRESHGLLQRHYCHPLLGYPLLQQQLTWENQLDTARYPWLADHKVGEGVVFPGAGYIELALAATAQQQTESDLLELEALEIHAPLLLSDAPSKVVRVAIDPADGALSISARPHASDDSWTAHVSARLLEQPTGLALQRSLAMLPQRAPDFDRVRHTELTQMIGLGYGPAFSTIAHGWIEADVAIGEFDLPPQLAIDSRGYLLHPGLLDSAFQLAFPLLQHSVAHAQSAHRDLAYVPTRIERILVRRGGGLPRYATAQVLRHAPHSLTAVFALYDADGQCVALADQARFKAIRLRKGAAQQMDYLDYQLTPAPRNGLQATAALVWDRIDTALGHWQQAWQADSQQARYSSELEPLLDAHHSAVLRQLMTALADPQGRLDTARVAALGEQSEGQQPLLEFCLAQAESHGVLSVVDGGWKLSDDPDAIAPELVWNALLQDYPDYFALVLLTGRVGQRLPALLQGEIDAGTLSSGPQRYPELFNAIVGESSTQLLTGQLAGLVNELLTQLPAGQRLRLLETGSADPWLAERLAPLLNLQRCDLSFASQSEQGNNVAQALQQRFPLLGVKDLAQTGQDQHLGLVALNGCSLDAARMLLRGTLAQLVPGAPTLLVGCHGAGWLDAALGVAPEWWQAQSGLPPRSNHLGQAQWQQLLQEAGFTQLRVFPFGGAYLLLAQAPDEVSNDALQPALGASTLAVAASATAARWLLVSTTTTPTAFDYHCSSQLQAEGATVSLLNAEQALSCLQQGESFDQVVMLPSAVDCPYSTTLSLQQLRISQLTQLVQAAEGRGIAPAWRVVTRGVGALYRYDDRGTQADQVAAQEAAPDAALWGFTRTLMNELGEGSVTLLDLPPDDAELSQWWPALQLELLAPDHEAELFIAADGARHAPRLRLESRPGEDKAKSGEQYISLGFELPGQLRNLRWGQHALQAPAADEIEVAVKATGLNFRDVMYTLGLLSDEAIENGFAGPTLGLEFAGTVTRVGADIDSFQVGDSVVGFGPASFSSRVLTRTQAVTRIPAGLSFEAAATIPCTFFTVYYALHYLARLQPGERVLIHGAAGGVGIAAIQVAQWLGAEIYATAGSDEKRDFLRLLGVEHIYDSRALQFADQILTATPDGRGVDVVLNSLAGEAINRNLRILKPMGRFLELGKRDFYENTHIGLRPFRNNISYFGIDSDQVMQECPELTQRLFGEMMALFEDGVLYPLPFTSFDANHVEEAFRYMQQARQIGKVVVTYAQGVANPIALERGARPALQLRADATYLVSGGLGGFGLRTARWLAEKGAGHLLLISRSGAVSAEAQQALAEFAAAGVAVTAEACDVTDGAALEALLARCGDTLPPLRGVVHAATVIDDALIRNLSAEQIESVLTPKIAGAMQLDRLTRELELDLFVLYSSATTLMGNPGQSVYVAANHWLEALASARRQRGLPATCARWGAIDDVGFLARNEKIKEALQSRMGGGALSAAVALDALEQMLLAQSTTLGVMELEWGALQRFLPSAEQPKFREIALMAEDSGAGSDEQVDIQQLIDTLSEQELQQTIAAMLAHELSRILLIPEEQVDVERSVYDMGLDSLMGVELMVAIESRFGINVPVMVLSEAPTLNKLSDYLIAQLRGDSDDVEPDQMTRTALQHGVSGEELARLQAAPQLADKARLIQ